MSSDVIQPDLFGLAHRLQSARNPDQQAQILSDVVLQEFDRFYLDFRAIPGRAKSAFEERDFPQSLLHSQNQLLLYGERMHALASTLAAQMPASESATMLWDELEMLYRGLVSGRYEADLALAFLHSVRRSVFMAEWKAVDYSVGIKADASAAGISEMMASYPASTISAGLLQQILDLPGFSTPYRDQAGDAALAAQQINALLSSDQGAHVVGVDVIRGGFFRNRGAYIVGRIRLTERPVVPLILALLNDEDGIYIDAVPSSESAAHNLFSTTRANFIVTNDHYHELSEFLHGIMPKRPLGLHYSSIGFNHFGKVAVMDELNRELDQSGALFDTAIGFPGTVAIGFQAPDSAYNLKVIRDHPTEGYKWGDFAGVDSVLAKYSQVHDINRTGSMLDNVIYYNVTLPQQHFNNVLLDEMLRDAGYTVSLRGSSVVFHHLIVQRRMIPLPVFLENASRADCERAVVNLGYCIKNNMAANIFNRDLDGRNYGVGSHIRVYLFDYDALEPFTEVKIRSNADRYDGEEDIPDWVFEDGVIFLPEEIESGLRLADRSLRQLFRSVHGDLLRADYWERIQDELCEGKVPAIQVYPESYRLHH